MAQIVGQNKQYLGILPLIGESRYMSDVMWMPFMQAIFLPGDLIQGLLSLSTIPQSYGTVSARTQWSRQALAQNS